MTTPYGTFTVYGVQSGLPSGGPVTLGPLLIPFSDCQSVSTYTFPSAGEEAFAPPTDPTPNGVWIIPSNGSATTLAITPVGSSTATNISPVYPTFIAFDPNHPLTAFALTAGATMTVAIQYV